MKISSIMSELLAIRIDGSWNLEEVRRIFESMRTEFLFISRSGRVEGLIARDSFLRILKDLNYPSEKLNSISIASIVSPPERFCSPDSDVEEVRAAMSRDMLPYLVVKDLDQIVGVVKYSTVAAADRTGSIGLSGVSRL